MIGNNPVRDILLAIGIGVGDVSRRLDQRAHQVNVIIVVLALQHRSNPLQPHSGVN